MDSSRASCVIVSALYFFRNSPKRIILCLSQPLRYSYLSTVSESGELGGRKEKSYYNEKSIDLQSPVKKENKSVL